MIYTVILQYPPDVNCDGRPAYYSASPIAANNTADAIRAARLEALFAMEIDQRRGRKHTDFDVLMVLGGQTTLEYIKS